MIELHKPVMLNEALNYLKIKENGIYIDCTFGTGGHSQNILTKLKNDKSAQEIVKNKEIFNSPQFQLISDNFANLEKHLESLKIKEIDGFLFDLGLSSSQLDAESRGFSYRLNSPLDMRMNQENKLQVEEIINNYSQEKLADIFYHYGEERKALGIIASCFPKKGNKHPARKAFQALRIYLNRELENLTHALEIAVKHLAPGGKMVVISYHSLEDRIVKQTFKEYNAVEDFQLICKKPSVPDPTEIKKNYRAHSAKMRVLERIK
ncbi:14402_t:CDS:2 [Funneliformis geosporum]|uniref:14402_t:CDS:1 n=1 Tax=Funneliformis geosporum TaxID=1117311 RepID=A0A9W4SRU3_9GLOM|nr:14402_t:CDS:2 [Funneliformis geosporum]